MKSDYLDIAVLTEVFAQPGYEDIHAMAAEVIFLFPDFRWRSSSFQGRVARFSGLVEKVC